MQNFIRLNAIKSEIELSQEFLGNGISAPPTDLRIQIASLLYLIVYTLHINFCAVSSTRNQNQRIQKKFQKSETTASPQKRFSPKVDRNKFMLVSH